MAKFQYATKSGALSTPFEAADSAAALSAVAGFSDAASGSGVAAYTPIAGEVSALSSANGKDRFATNVAPKINAANQTVAAAQQAAQERAAAAAKAKTSGGEIVPPEVQAELDANKDPMQKFQEAQQASWDKQEADARALLEGFTLANNASAAAAIGQQTSMWQERRQLLERSNKANVASWNQQFLRSGQAEYSPGMTGDMVTEKEQEGIRKVQALDNEYNSTVAAINAARDSKNYSAAANLAQTLAGIEEKALAQMEKNAKEAQAANDAMRKNLRQTTQEMAISKLVGEGITDAATILDYLNNTEDGQLVGNITLEEIDKVLKIVAPDSSLSGLSADFRTFKFLQDTKDPTVEGMSYLDFTKAVAMSKKTGTESGSGGGYSAQETRKLRAAGIDASDIEAADEFLYGQGDNGFELSSSQRSQLLSGGFNFDDVKAMEADLAKYGLEQVTQGMDPKQKDLVKRVLAGSDSVDDVGQEAERFIDTAYLEELFTDDALKVEAKNAGFRGVMTSWSTEKKKYLEYLMTTVEQYRKAGKTDAEILKEMQ